MQRKGNGGRDSWNEGGLEFSYQKRDPSLLKEFFVLVEFYYFFDYSIAGVSRN